ncbi:unnamed protein product, partial [Musa banksii]
MAVTASHPLLLLLLLSLRLLAVANGASKALACQTLVVTPLASSKPLLSEDADDGDENLASAVESETTLPSSPSSSLHVHLSHRDSLLADTTAAEQIFLLRLDRDAARVETLSQILAVATAPPAANVTSRRGFSSKVVSGLAQGSGEYFARIGIGTPARYAYMVLDTGSDVVWLQCAPCRRCYSQSDPIFDPRNSRSYAAIPCGAPLCRRLDVAGCDTRRRSCLYQVSYGDGSITTGEFSTETLTFRRSARVPRIALGCGHDNEGLFVAAAGLLGLGRGSLSFVSGRPTVRPHVLVLPGGPYLRRRAEPVIFGGVRRLSGAQVFRSGRVHAHGAEPQGRHFLLRRTHGGERGRDASDRSLGVRPPAGSDDGEGRGDRGLGHISDAAGAAGIPGAARRLQGRGFGPEAGAGRLLPLRHMLRPVRADGGEGADGGVAPRRRCGSVAAGGELPHPGGHQGHLLLRLRRDRQRRFHHRQHTAARVPGGVRRGEVEGGVHAARV